MNKKRGLIAQINFALKTPRWGVSDALYAILLIVIGAGLAGGINWAKSAPVLPPGWRYVQAAPVSPLETENATIEPSVTPTPSPQASLKNIVQYIATTFEPEGKAVVVEAINCFYSESKLNPQARGYNRNGTTDSGIAQINSIHQITPQQAFDYRKNIDKAYEIYKSRGWSAWYGRGCGRLAYNK